MARPSRHIIAVLLATVAFLMAGALSRAQETLKQGDILSGQLRLVKTRHPNGTPISAYQIVIDNPRDFAEKDGFCNDTPKTFHVVVIGDKAKASRLNRLIGQNVAVIGEEFFCSQTAWHIGDAVVTKWWFAKPGGH
jgi:hypothetical protein